MMATHNPYPPDHYIGLYLAQATDDEAAGYLLGKIPPVDGVPGCNCPHCQDARERARLTRVQPPTMTAMQIVGWHVANAENDDPRFRGDVDWAQNYLKESVKIGWLKEAEANEIRAAVGWDVTAVQMRMGI